MTKHVATDFFCNMYLLIQKKRIIEEKLNSFVCLKLKSRAENKFLVIIHQQINKTIWYGCQF